MFALKGRATSGRRTGRVLRGAMNRNITRRVVWGALNRTKWRGRTNRMKVMKGPSRRRNSTIGDTSSGGERMGRFIQNPTKVGRDWDDWRKMSRGNGGGGTTRGFWSYPAKAGPKHHLMTTGSCFGARAIVVVIAQDLEAVVAGDLHTTPAWDEMRGADEEARHTLRAPVNYWTNV
jgi:hypothetical protein